MSSILQPLKIFILAVIISIGISYASAWTAPTAAPPGNNVPPPINTSVGDQIKTGGLLNLFNLWVNGALGVTGGASVGGNVTVAGTIESTSGGFKFPDGTTQTTAMVAGTVVGVCGSANGAVALASAPTTNLCNAGTPSAVSGAGPWTWTCSGTGGAANAACSVSTLSVIGVPSITTNPYSQASGWFTRTGGAESSPYSNVRQTVIRWNGSTVYDSIASGPITLGGVTYTPSTYMGSVYGWNGDYSNAYIVIKK